MNAWKLGRALLVGVGVLALATAVVLMGWRQGGSVSTLAVYDRADELSLAWNPPAEDDLAVSAATLGRLGTPYFGVLPGPWPGTVLSNRTPLAVCFAPGTSDEIMDAVNQAMLAQAGGPLAYYLTGRWSGSQGSPRSLTWSFVPDGLNIPSGIGEPAAASELFSRMDALFGGNRALWISKFQQCFDRWASLVGTDYTRITFGGNDWDDGGTWGLAGNANRGDVRISMKNIDGGFNVLAYNQFPSNGDMVIDRSESWNSVTNDYRFLRNTLMHEHGHGLGLLHVCPLNNSKLMEPNLATNFDGPQHDDIRAGQRHYGDDYEDNNTSAGASDLGVLTAGATLTLGTVPAPSVGPNTSILSIDAEAEQDYFKFTITGPRDVSVTVTPKGLSYDSSQQSGPSCLSGNFINSLTAANLNVSLLDTDGTTVLINAAAQPAGSVESFTFPITAAGDYYIRVYEDVGSPTTETQLYEMTIATNTCVDDLDCSDGQFCNGAETCNSGNCLAGADPCPGLNCSNAAGACMPFAPVIDPGDTGKNRYVSFTPNNGPGVTGYRLDMTASGKFPGSVGTLGWVGPPFEAGCPAACSGIFIARVVDEASAHFTDTWPTTVHVGDCEITPDADFELRAILDGADKNNPANYSAPLPLATVPEPTPKKWGDCVGSFFIVFWDGPNGVVNFNDVSAALQKYIGDPTAPHLTAIDVHDEVPNALINISDVFLLIKAFQGNEYPFSDPALCP
ncbi:MAG: matrixin family metalloprotease [Planctomycetes bacterium]|nr:matrixin family metalloprotease [Planctomycetota bacterium]